MQQYILALDQGTTSSRAVLLDRTGAVVHKAQRPFGQIYPKPGWVEHDPMEILSSEYSAVRDVLESANIKPGQICAVGITNQRETTVVWEKATGRPIYNAIVWQCRRTAAICEGLEADGLSNYIADTTGLIPDAYFSATKLKWILDAVPGARSRAQRGELLFGTVDTWLIWNLTGGKAHVTDFSNASRTMLFNIDTLKWDELLCQKLDIPKGMLPLCCPSSHIYGTVAKLCGLELLEGVPIAGDAGDQQAALFGQTCFEEGEAKNTFGTGCFTLMNTGEKRVMADKGLLSVIAWGIGSKVQYALEGSVFNAGSVIQWLRDELGIIKTAHEADVLAETVSDTQGVIFVPAFTGLGAPYWDMYARGTILGLTRGAGKAHIARAVLESIAYQVSDLFYTMREVSGIALKELRVDGGASVSDFLMQFQADMLGIRVDRPQNIETTAAGAGFLAGLACGFWPDQETLKACRESERIFLPQMEPSSREALYANWKRGVERSLEWAK